MAHFLPEADKALRERVQTLEAEKAALLKARPSADARELDQLKVIDVRLQLLNKGLPPQQNLY